MAIKHALLGLLAEGPKHGYELKTAFDETIGERWSLNIGQVYNTLNRLARDGYVVLQEEVEQETRPDKKIYAITEAGREELSRWLAKAESKGLPHCAPRRLCLVRCRRDEPHRAWCCPIQRSRAVPSVPTTG